MPCAGRVELRGLRPRAPQGRPWVTVADRSRRSIAPRYVSLFSGALGLDLGFEAAGWHCLAANELDRWACETIRANRPRLRLYQGDVRELRAERLRADLGLATGELDALVAGPPCQAFSTAGRRRSFADPRGDLALHLLALAFALRPRWIVLENVRGLLSAPLQHRPHRQRDSPPEPEERPGGALARVVALLEHHGYAVSFRLYDAVVFGAAQRRERLVIIAGRDGDRSGPVPTNRPFGAPRTVREAFAEAGMDGAHLPLRPRQARLVSLLGPGQNWRDLPLELQAEALGGAYRSTGGRAGFLRRVAWDAPSPTLVTNPTMPATLLAHPEELRPLSIGEYKRLQGFPDGWRVAGPLTAQYRQVGNAVPVPLGEAVARHLIAGSVGSSRQKTCRYSRTDDEAWRQDHAAVLADARAGLGTRAPD